MQTAQRVTSAVGQGHHQDQHRVRTPDHLQGLGPVHAHYRCQDPDPGKAHFKSVSLAYMTCYKSFADVL